MEGAYSPHYAIVLFTKNRGNMEASDDKELRVWKAGTGELVCVHRGHTGKVRQLKTVGDGEVFVSGSADEGDVIFWDATMGTKVTSIKGEAQEGVDGGGGVSSLLFRDKGEIWGGFSSGRMSVWEAEYSFGKKGEE
eukprot:CAMPEP_0201525770 /NCGR_PEP_ID=MMETSP0161_2-20130828/29453_1 /ASSEMBLY_ACC=CAM_ASM_000251 /TAXON_ID=180227 /ORGANISM="Neoparamoeba aestuarina, Strain SoJaBio B1-5/56/2" /LENGTH=135 /DNA_ID=CAMNT_0047925857 /DNA_START=335 /DNA_END=743 /DNA_ORIENTATION=-